MPQLNAYLVFDGNTADAMRFYESILGGKLDLMTNAASPVADQTPPEAANRIMHARLVFDGGTLMASDGVAGQHYDGMKGFALSLYYPTAAEGQKMFEALGQGGKVTMPFQKTFWAEGFGMLTDRFGTPWMVNSGAQSA